jgi:hypothetical protein
MNRLVLIGNGFDLAHRLPTSYQEFIYWYWKSVVAYLLLESRDVYEDKLCKVTNNKLDYWNLRNLYHSENKELYDFLVNNDGAIDIEYSLLFERINKSIQTKRWVDIENEYYFMLRNRVLPINTSSDKDVQYLNLQLDLLKHHLMTYLNREQKSYLSIIEEIKEKIYRQIEEKEIAVSFLKTVDKSLIEDKKPSSVMLLNFNYTNLPEHYVDDSSNVVVNYIHGKLDKPGSVIFGYGDEFNEDFKRLQSLNENECLRHIKSIRYLESDNYRKMLEFIESAPFQVCIMGHSCGNSDRTLLNTLFEHKNCISIKPYYYINEKGEDNYLELVQNISRNFTDMKLMRDRVVNKEYTETLTHATGTETDTYFTDVRCICFHVSLSACKPFIYYGSREWTVRKLVSLCCHAASTMR